MPPLARPGRTLLSLLLLLLLAGIPGCIDFRLVDLSEHSYPPNYDRLVRVPNPERLPTRPWTARLHQAAAPLLPRGRNDALTTDQLSTGGQPTGVWQHFHLQPEHLDNIFFNLRALEQSSQTVSPTAGLDSGPVTRPAWDGFREVQVPVPGNASLYARLGTPEPQNEIPGSFVIITHGLFGTLDGMDVQNHVQTLRRAGHHVLAIEMRGHGQTQIQHPEYAITFGIAETGDLLAAARWLKTTHHATRVGLVTFSLTGFEALLAAWLDGAAPVIELQTLPLNALLPPHQPDPAFNAGMFIISAPIDILDVAARFEPQVSFLQAPVKYTFQNHVRRRLDYYKLSPGYTMWDLARCEFPRNAIHGLYPSFEAAKPDFMRFLDLSADHWSVGAARIENIRIPLLILNAANDPLATAQGVADLFARQHNPNLGVILLPEGSHIGFTAYSADYYYSLMLNFFDPATAPLQQPR